MLVVADKQALRIGGEGGFAGSAEAKEDRRVLPVHVGVRGAVHGSHALQRKEVVHHGEHALLHLSAIPCVQDHLLFGGDVEGDAGLAIEAKLLVVGDFGFGGVIDNEIGFEGLQFVFAWADEHILDEMGLPSDFHDEADRHAGVFVGPAIGVDDEEALVGKLLKGELVDLVPGLLAHRVVVVGVAWRVPPDGVLAVVVDDEVFVFGGAPGVDAGHDVDRA